MAGVSKESEIYSGKVTDPHGIVFLVINFFYFSKDRIKKIEFKYDSLPARTRKIGNVISWIVLVIPMAAFLYVGLMITPCYMLGFGIFENGGDLAFGGFAVGLEYCVVKNVIASLLILF